MGKGSFVGKVPYKNRSTITDGEHMWKKDYYVMMIKIYLLLTTSMAHLLPLRTPNDINYYSMYQPATRSSSPPTPLSHRRSFAVVASAEGG